MPVSRWRSGPERRRETAARVAALEVGEEPMSAGDEDLDFDEDVGGGECDSGPFCRHWSDPFDCEKVCARCGHLCGQHGESGCREEDCECEQWEWESDER